MINALVRYRAKPECAAENERLIGKVFEQLAREKPTGLQYAAFKEADGVSFVHVAVDEAPDGTSTLGKLSAFKEFTAGIDDRAETPRVRTALEMIGSYSSSAG